MKNYYKIITYGCQMNVHESEKLAGMLESLDYEATNKVEQASVIVFNTCTIREGAVNKAFGNIGALKKLKEKNPNLIIAVGGCMTQNEVDAIRLKKTFPFVSIIFGTHNLHEFKNYILEYKQNNKRIYNIWKDDTLVPAMTEIHRSDRLNAWVNIIFGCNNFCTYCIVPYVRGRERSRDFNEIVNECKMLIKQGYKTITLLGQNVNSYGNDVTDNNVTFAKLLKAVASLEGNFKVKFMTSNPKDLNDAVIDVIATQTKVSKAIHLPVQSGSNNVLKNMNRKYTIEHYLEVANKIKTRIPNVGLSSDFIVGFPGETEEDFEQTKDLIKKVKFDVIFAYMYSKRSGTKANDMENQVELLIKNRRVNELLSLQKEITNENRQKIIGKNFNVLVEKLENNLAIARNDAGKTIKIKADNLKIGQFVDVEIVSTNKKETLGKVI